MKYLKKIIYIIGLIVCLYVAIINIFFVAIKSDDSKEIMKYFHLGIIQIIGILIIIGIILFISIKLNNFFEKNEINKNIKRYIFLLIFAIYVLISFIWIYIIDSYPIADSLFVYNGSYNMYINQEIKNLQYFEKYPQNLTLSYFFSIIFKILHSDKLVILKILNVIANCFSIYGLFNILKLLDEKYKTNKFLLGILVFTYLPIIFLCNFTYGDFVSMPFSIFAIYFAMKYSKNDKIYNLIISSVLMMFSIILRMNNLIYLIAISIYLILNLNQKTEHKIINNNYLNICFKFLIIITFFITSIIPFNILKHILLNKYDINKEYFFPREGHILMGMLENEPRANGWYLDEIAKIAFDNDEGAKEVYRNLLKERVNYFSNNILYTLNFYNEKLMSMWAEPLQDSIWQNLSFNFGTFYVSGNDDLKNKQKENDKILKNNKNKVIIYQKSLILIIFLKTILFCINNKKNISNEVLLLLLCFIGGFLFHTLWEAKSRYIINYIIILAPIASLYIKQKEEKFNFTVLKLPSGH